MQQEVGRRRFRGKTQKSKGTQIMLQVILWDLDDTLLNFDYSEKTSIESCFKSFALGPCPRETTALYSAINRKYWQLLERGEMNKPDILTARFVELFTRLGIDTRLAPTFNAEYEKRLGDAWRLTEGAIETLTALRGRVLQCAVTNGSGHVQTKKLRASGLDALLDQVFISDVLGVEKPARAFFESVFAEIGEYPREKVLIVGDSPSSDIQGGINAGIRTCLFNPLGKPANRSVPADYEIERLSEVIELVKA